MIGRVYKIIHSQSKICYIGSTRNTLVKRWQHHKRPNNDCCIAKYFKIYGIDQFKIMLIKEYEVCDRKHLLAYEQLWISKLSTIEQKNTLLIRRQQRKQWYEANKNQILKQSKVYYESNKERKKQKYMCECGSEIRCDNKTRHERSVKHLAGKINIPKGPKYKCECGSESTIHNKTRHEKTKKHQDWITTQA